VSPRLLAYGIAALAIAGAGWAVYTAIYDRGYQAAKAEQTSADLQALRDAVQRFDAERARQDALAAGLASTEAGMRQATASLQREARAHAQANADLAKVRLNAELLADWNAGAAPP
jgi:hypothetical protein